MLRLALLFHSRRPRARLLLSVIGIALGVALGYAVHLVNRAAVADVSAAVRALAGEADIEVRGGRTGFPDALYPQVARLTGVRTVSPVLELDAGLAGTERTLRVIGLDVLRAVVLQPALAVEERFELLTPDKTLLSAGAASALALGKGDRLRLVVGQRAVEFTVAGVLPGAALGGQAALVDIASAQWRFERLGELNRLDVRLAQGAERATVGRRNQALVAAGVVGAPVETLGQAGGFSSGAFRVNLNLLAMGAAFPGRFLVFSAQAL